jgi:hypothetical protein
VKKSEWSDKQLEELLRQMPKINDHRNPRDIYQNLSIKKSKTKQWLLPGIATAAALLLLLILVPKLINGTNYSYDNASQEKSSINKEIKLADNNNDLNRAMDNDVASSSKKKDNSGTAETNLMKTSSIKTAIYDDEVGNGKVVTYWIPDKQGQILIPVSTIVTDTKDKSWFTLFNENMANLKEGEWGLTDFYPLNATLKLDESNNSIIADVPSSHQYGQGSSNETNFINVLQKDITSNSNLKKIKFSTDGTPGIELGNFGGKEELDIASEKNHAFFFYYTDGSKLPFLVPASDTYQDISTAIDAMKDDQPVFGLKRSLMPSMLINDVSIVNKTLYVTIKSNSDLQDDQLTLSSYEALLLTAKDFGLEKVFVKNSPLTNIGPFDLSKENKVPLAPNLRSIQ